MSGRVIVCVQRPCCELRIVNVSPGCRNTLCTQSHSGITTSLLCFQGSCFYVARKRGTHSALHHRPQRRQDVKTDLVAAEVHNQSLRLPDATEESRSGTEGDVNTTKDITDDERWLGSESGDSVPDRLSRPKPRYAPGASLQPQDTPVNDTRLSVAAGSGGGSGGNSGGDRGVDTVVGHVQGAFRSIDVVSNGVGESLGGPGWLEGRLRSANTEENPVPGDNSPRCLKSGICHAGDDSQRCNEGKQHHCTNCEYREAQGRNLCVRAHARHNGAYLRWTSLLHRHFPLLERSWSFIATRRSAFSLPRKESRPHAFGILQHRIMLMRVRNPQD